MEEYNERIQLERSITWLESLLQNGETDEGEYQKYFEENPMVFRVLGYKQFLAFTKQSGKSLPPDEYSGLKPEPDFIGVRDDGLVEIFEIKTPVMEKLIVDSNRYRERFTSQVSSYISQTITYEKYFTRNPENRKRVNELYNINIHEDLDIKIVIGRNEYIDRVKVHQQCREYKYKIDILTYDDVLNRLVVEHERRFGGYENLEGFSFHFVIRIGEQKSQNNAYIFDTGNVSNRNRISFYVDKNGDLCFRVVDDIQKEYVVSAGKNEYIGQWVYLGCDFGKMQDGFIMTLGINGNENDKRVKNVIVNVDVPLKIATLGCDLSKIHFGSFDIAENFIVPRTLGFREKSNLLNYIADKYKELRDVNSWAEFNGQKFMYIDNNNNLVQDSEVFKPTYRRKV